MEVPRHPEVLHDVAGPADRTHGGDSLHLPVPDEDPRVALVGRRVDEVRALPEDGVRRELAPARHPQ
eukprot:9566731-Alexandrium_andersonii.AAC.1